MTAGARGGEPDSPLRGLVRQLGGHPATALGLDLEHAPDRARWLAATRLLSERVSEAAALEVFRRLDAEVGTTPHALCGAGPERVAAALEAAGFRRAEGIARTLCRAAQELSAPEGDLETRAAEALDLADLGGRIAILAPGLGHATVLRFLRPLRDVWTAARETPSSASTRAAAVHLGLLAEGEDEDGEPSALRRACAECAPDLHWIDLEAALERLGARACRPGRPARCPLGAACPLRPAGRDALPTPDGLD